MQRGASLTQDHDAVGIEPVFWTIFETLEHALRRPEHGAGFQPNRQRDFRPGVAIVAFPLALALAADGFAHISAEPEDLRAKLLRQVAAGLGLAVRRLLVDEAIDVLQAFEAEIGLVTPAGKRLCHPMGRLDRILDDGWPKC